METADGSDGLDTNAQLREGLQLGRLFSPSAKEHKRKANVPG